MVFNSVQTGTLLCHTKEESCLGIQHTLTFRKGSWMIMFIVPSEIFISCLSRQIMRRLSNWQPPRKGRRIGQRLHPSNIKTSHHWSVMRVLCSTSFINRILNNAHHVLRLSVIGHISNLLLYTVSIHFYTHKIKSPGLPWMPLVKNSQENIQDYKVNVPM